MTSLAFILVWVPEPVCQTTSGNSSSSLPSATSCAAWAIALAISGSSWPMRALTLAVASLTMPSAHHRRRHALAADLEVLQRALRLGAPVAVGLDLDRAEGVGLGSVPGHRTAPPVVP
jgi:hypothetical protein